MTLNRSLRFTTESGAMYVLTEFGEWLAKTGGESLADATPVLRAKLTRESTKPLIHVDTLGPVSAEPAGEWVTFQRPPTVGESFYYWHPTLFGCGSTPVVSIELTTVEEIEPEPRPEAEPTKVWIAQGDTLVLQDLPEPRGHYITYIAVEGP